MTNERGQMVLRMEAAFLEQVGERAKAEGCSRNEWVVRACATALDAKEPEGLLRGLLLERAMARAAEKGMGLAEWMAKVAEWALTVAENPAKRITTLREPTKRPDPDADSPVVWEEYFAALKGVEWELLTPVERADLKDFKAGRNPARRRGQE